MVVLANSTKMCYTYDDLSRVTVRTIKSLDDDSIISTETFTYDAAGNITDAPDSCFAYDTNNRLITFCGNPVSYDLDGNMLSNGTITCTYDSANRLITAGGHTYTYNAEDVRIRNLCDGHDTKYTYDTNRKLSRLLFKDTNGVVTKYVYGKGLIGEEKQGCSFKTYHFDSRGSTIAITDASGNITDTFAYDTYGKLLSRTGTSFVIFGYNGRDGVVTDKNGLIYMRARYYSPEMKRFINADIVAGAISNAVTLNRYAYANSNPVSFVDPFGLSPDERDTTANPVSVLLDIFFGTSPALIEGADWLRNAIYRCKYNNILLAQKPKQIHQGSWILKTREMIDHLDDAIGPSSNIAKGISTVGKVINVVGNVVDASQLAWNVGTGISENIQNGTDAQRTTTDALVDIGVCIGSGLFSSFLGRKATELPFVKSFSTPLTTLIGVGVTVGVGLLIDLAVESISVEGTSILGMFKEYADISVDFTTSNSDTISIVGASMYTKSGGAMRMDKICFGDFYYIV